KLEMAQYRDVAGFAQFASDLDPATRQQLTRGQRLTELLKQGLASPMRVEDQIIVIYAGGMGVLDDIENEQVRNFESGLLKFVYDRYPEIPETIRTKKTADSVEDTLKTAVTEFKKGFKG
ncbi:F0F1 ATP synthase subunit alpha, partial [bacterium]